jgi:hypothetical protein
MNKMIKMNVRFEKTCYQNEQSELNEGYFLF